MASVVVVVVVVVAGCCQASCDVGRRFRNGETMSCHESRDAESWTPRGAPILGDITVEETTVWYRPWERQQYTGHPVTYFRTDLLMDF